MRIHPDAPAIACVLINWNNWLDTAHCLESLSLQDYPNLHVLVVDNGSSNDSVARLRGLHPWATFLELPANLGFPRACNLGARHVLTNEPAPFLWFLNNDTVVPPDTASLLMEAALAHPRAGVVGSVLRYLHDPTQVQAWGGGSISCWTGYNTHLRAPAPLGPSSYLTFASVLVRRQAFDQLGGLYEGAFMYFEDCDFCLRARQAGWDLAVAPGTAILHKEGGAEEGTAPSPHRLRATTVAGLHFVTRHAPVPWLGRLLFLGTRLAKRLLTLDLAAARTILAGARAFRHRDRAGARP